MLRTTLILLSILLTATALAHDIADNPAHDSMCHEPHVGTPESGWWCDSPALWLAAYWAHESFAPEPPVTKSNNHAPVSKQVQPTAAPPPAQQSRSLPPPTQQPPPQQQEQEPPPQPTRFVCYIHSLPKPDICL